VVLFEHRLREAGVATPDELRSLQDGVEAEVEDIVRFADESPNPDVGELYRYLYGGEWEMYRDA